MPCCIITAHVLYIIYCLVPQYPSNEKCTDRDFFIDVLGVLGVSRDDRRAAIVGELAEYRIAGLRLPGDLLPPRSLDDDRRRLLLRGDLLDDSRRCLGLRE